MRFPQNLDEDLAYVLGSMRDGSLIYSKDKKYWVRIYDNKNSTWLEVLSDMLESLFEVKFHLRFQKKFDEKYLDISCKNLFYFIKNLVDGKLHEDVPTIIKNSDKKIKKAYISGFFDAEGYVPYPTVKNKRFRIAFNQKNKNSLLFIKETLETLGIKCSKISQHVLSIYGKKNLIKFYNDFKIKNPEKLERFELLIGNTLPE
jgi:intein-encoded DNA endonuclease-like protein